MNSAMQLLTVAPSEPLEIRALEGQLEQKHKAVRD